MNYVKSLNMFGIEAKEIPCIRGEGTPTTETEGAVGCLYMDTLTGMMYKCVAASNEVGYTWEAVLDNHAMYFGIETDGTIYLKPKYRGAIVADKDVSGDKTYSISNNGSTQNGSEIHNLPEVLYIPSTVNGIGVTQLAPGMFAYNKRIKQVILPDSITKIPKECFAYTTNLTEVKNTKQITTIGEGAFFASGVLDMDFPILATLGTSAFRYAGHLKKIHIGNVTTILDRCFEHCFSLEELNHNLSITKIGKGAFHYAASLKELDFLNNDAGVTTLTYIGEGAFLKCGLNFDWATFYNTYTGVTYGERATPLKSNPSLIKDGTADTSYFNMRIEARELPAPLRMSQDNPEWTNKQFNHCTTYSKSCTVFSFMNAYCGIKGIKYDEPYSFATINESIDVPEAYIKDVDDGAILNGYFDISNLAPPNYDPKNGGVIVKYTGASGITRIKSYTREGTVYNFENDCKTSVTENRFQQDYYYRLDTEYDRDNTRRLWYWTELGTRKITNLDLYSSVPTCVTLEQFYKGLGLNRYRGEYQTASIFPDIIAALQNGSYVTINITPSYEGDNGGGHTILLYGVKSNGEVLFVDSSVPGLTELEDYRAGTGSMFLQNLIIEGSSGYQIISEGGTKTLLNETIDKETDQIWSILQEVLKTMDLNLMKTHYTAIKQTESVDTLTVSVDFEPKLVLFNYTGGVKAIQQVLKNFVNAATTGCALAQTCWIKENLGGSSPEFKTQAELISRWDSTKQAAADATRTFSGTYTWVKKVEYNSSTDQWDIEFARASSGDDSVGKIIGNPTTPLTYHLFVAG